MNNHQLTHIFFDLDDTLWDFRNNSTRTFEYIFKQRNLPIAIQDFITVYRPINDQYWAAYRENHIDRSTLRFGRLSDSFTALDFKASEELIWGVADDFMKYLSEFNQVFPGTHETLTYLQKKYSLHIVTNGFSEVQDRKLKKSKLIPYFDSVTCSDVDGVKKPHPQIFQSALRKAGARKENSVMIGDNLEADIKGAAQFGLQVIYFKPEGEMVYEGKRIRSLLELIDLL